MDDPILVTFSRQPDVLFKTTNPRIVRELLRKSCRRTYFRPGERPSRPPESERYALSKFLVSH
jgi:hypothetical protein